MRRTKRLFLIWGLVAILLAAGCSSGKSGPNKAAGPPKPACAANDPALAKAAPDSFLSVAFLEGNFLALDLTGKVLSSPDGRAWTQVADAGAPLTGVTFARGEYLAVGPCGVVLKSTGGKEWAKHTVTAQLMRSPVFYKGDWVAAGRQKVLISRDGITWEEKPTPGESITRVIIREDYLVALHEDGNVTWSRGLLDDWLPIRPVQTPLYGIALGKEYAVAVGEGGVILSGFDTRIWSRRTAGTEANLLDVTFGTAWVAVGDGGVVLTSSNGKDWKVVRPPGGARLRAVAYGPPGFVAVGDQGTILFSADGAAWESVRK